MTFFLCNYESFCWLDLFCILLFLYGIIEILTRKSPWNPDIICPTFTVIFESGALLFLFAMSSEPDVPTWIKLCYAGFLRAMAIGTALLHRHVCDQEAARRAEERDERFLRACPV